MLPIAMRLCTRTVAATQFTLYMALSNFGITMGAALLGLADVLGGIGSLFGLVAVVDLVAIAILLTVASRRGRSTRQWRRSCRRATGWRRRSIDGDWIAGFANPPDCCTRRWCPGEDSNLHALASAST